MEQSDSRSQFFLNLSEQRDLAPTPKQDTPRQDTPRHEAIGTSQHPHNPLAEDQLKILEIHIQRHSRTLSIKAIDRDLRDRRLNDVQRDQVLQRQEPQEIIVVQVSV